MINLILYVLSTVIESYSLKNSLKRSAIILKVILGGYSSSVTTTVATLLFPSRKILHLALASSIGTDTLSPAVILLYNLLYTLIISQYIFLFTLWQF